MIKKVLYTNGFPVSDTKSTKNHFSEYVGCYSFNCDFETIF